jgi:hypothetical protein
VAGGAVWFAGVALLVAALPLTFILVGAALFQDGPAAAAFVLFLGLVPVALGVALAHVGRPGFWRRSIPVRDLWKMPGAAGVALLLVTVPAVFVAGQAGLAVALVALCVYPVLDVPRLLTRPSWWRGAAVSAAVWLLVFGLMLATLEGAAPIGEAGMLFLLPAMMYPAVLAISGVVRLAGIGLGRPAESGVRLVAILGAVACGLMVAVPVTTSLIPVAVEKVTGNTVGHTVYSEDGTVVSASTADVVVHLASGGTEPVGFGAGTKFDFRGPGSPVANEAAGPSWLKPGQRIGLEYAYRAHKAQASLVTIWVERKGCAQNARWTAAAAQQPGPGEPSLAGTTWRSRRLSQQSSSPAQSTTLEFLADRTLAYQDEGGTRYTNGLWKQAGSVVLAELNDCYAAYEGEIRGEEITGEFSNEVGFREAWTARRTVVGVAATAAAR